MHPKYIGFESANSFVKVFHDGQEMIYPNTISNAPRKQLNVENGFASNTVYTIKGKRIFVGRTINYTSSSMEDLARYSTKEYHIESIIALSHFAKNGDEIIAITGIPSNHFNELEESTRLIRENLVGEHSIKRNGESLNFVVKDVLVILQPLATFYYTVLDEWGNADKKMIERFNNSETLIIDIGWGTTDVAHLIGNGLEHWWNINTSMKDIVIEISFRLRDSACERKRKLCQAYDIDLLDLDKQVREKGIYRYANSDYHARDIARMEYEYAAHQIILELQNKVGFDKFQTVIWTGGGTQTLLPYLKEHLTNPNTNRVDDNIFFMGNSQIANAKGYYIYGKYVHQEVKA